MLEKYRNWTLPAAVAVLAVVLLYGQRSGIPAQTRQNDHEIAQNCQVANEIKLTLKTYILQQVQRSKDALPTIEYYKEHPVELGKALSNINQQEAETKRAFSPEPC